MTVLLKLGGSVITDKTTEARVDTASLDVAVDAINAAPLDDLVIVHGGGSFGHPAAARHGVDATTGTTDAGAIADIHGAMLDLNRAVVDALATAGVAAVGVHPLSMARRDPALTVDIGAIEELREEGFVPVLHGDGVVTAGAGVTVLSGDDLIVALADPLGIDRIGLCSDVPGVFDAEGTVLDAIGSFDEVADDLRGSSATDVTGGMAHKVRVLLDLPAPAAIFGLDDLSRFLAGTSVGTTIDAS